MSTPATGSRIRLARFWSRSPPPSSWPLRSSFFSVSGLPAWFGGLLYALIVIGLMGAALAAYFLDSYWLMALMIVGLVGCLAQLISSPGRGKIAPRALSAGRAP